MIKDACFNNRAMLLLRAGFRGAAIIDLAEITVRTKLWGRLEGAALYGSSKASRFCHLFGDAYHP
jgi:hypothetical protein